MKSVEEILNKPEIKELLKNNDLDQVYNTTWQCIQAKKLTEVFLECGVDPLDYFRTEIPGGFAEGINNSFYEDLIIPDRIKIIGIAAFLRSHLDSVVMPAELVQIEGSAFRDNNITKVDFSKCTKLQRIDGNTFKDNPSLKEVVLPDNNLTIEYNAFDKNTVVIAPRQTIFQDNITTNEKKPIFKVKWKK